MITVEVKNKEFNGERCGVGFVNGVAKVESLTPEQKAAFKKFDYKVSGVAEKESKKKDDDTEETPDAEKETKGKENKAKK